MMNWEMKSIYLNDIYKSSSCKNPAKESSWMNEILLPSKSLQVIENSKQLCYVIAQVERLH